MRALLRPGTRLLDHMRYPRKFLLISVLFLVPLVLAIGLLHSETQPSIAFTTSELAGTRYLRPARQLLEATLEARLTELRATQGDAAAQAQIAAGRSRVSAALEQVRLAESDAGERLGTASALAAVEARWQQIERQPATGEGRDSDYVALIGSVRELIALVGDRSNLILDPQLDSYYLMDAVLLKLPEQVDLTVEAEASGHPEAAPEQRSPFVIAGLLRQSDAALQKGLAVTFGLSASVEGRMQRGAAEHAAVIEAFSALAERHELGLAGTSDTAMADAGDRARRSSFALWDASVIELEALLQERVDRLEQKNSLALGVTLALLAVVLYLLACFYRSVMGTVRSLELAAQRLQAGEIRGAIALAAHDELGDVARSFNTVAEALAVASEERAAAQAAQARLQQEIIDRQEALLIELSTPLIPISDQVLVMPLIGTLDAPRIGRLISTLSQGVTERRATTVILDLTGVPQLSDGAAEGLSQAADVARMLGAEVMLTGIRASVAQELVRTNATVSKIAVHQSLQSGIAAARSLSRTA